VAVEYVHQELDREITAIGGTYLLVREVRLPLYSREVLYVVGHAAFDTSCCGPGGCGYALVPGFILKWKGETNQDHLAVSQVEPIHDKGVQEKVRRLIKEKESIRQVRFL
jgi:hypothetical protein